MDEPGFTTQDRRFLNGSIDEVHVFDRPLTECEVKVNALVPCPVDTDGDGVDDSEDNCSNTPAGSIVNADGCAPPPCTDGQAAGDLVSYWRADGTACDAADSNHGTPTDGAGFAPGNVGQAFSFDGVNDYVTVPDDTSLRLGKNQTIKAWYKWAGGGTNDWRRLVGKGASSPRNYGLWIHPQANVVLFQIYNQGATVGCGASLGVASDSNWHQLAGTYDGSRIKLY